MRGLGFIAGLLLAGTLGAAEAEIKLVQPDTKGGMPIMQAVAARRSNRSFSGKPLTPQQLSDLFYTAWGLSGAQGRRTVATARNVRDMEIFAAFPEGMYRYNAEKHALELTVKGDLRKFCGMQAFHGKAPVVLVYVSNRDAYAKAGMNAEHASFYAPVHTGSISQNVYLFAAANHLNTVVCGMVDKPKLARIMKLGPRHTIMLTQPVGYPAGK